MPKKRHRSLSGKTYGFGKISRREWNKKCGYIYFTDLPPKTKNFIEEIVLLLDDKKMGDKEDLYYTYKEWATIFINEDNSKRKKECLDELLPFILELDE